MEPKQQDKFPNNQSGITLIELIVSITIATIIIVSLTSILFTQYGSILAESSRANLRANGQALLTALQDELLFTIEYGHNLSTNLTDNFAPTGGWTYNTDPDTLIISEVALDAARADNNRNVIRQQLSACETSLITDNPVAINNIVYFTQDNPGSLYKDLYKRVVTPTYDTCSVDRNTGDPCTPETGSCLPNAKVTTCPVANVGSGGCARKDSLLSENVLDFSIKYFMLDNVETPFPSAAEKIEVSLVLGDRVFGRNIEVDVNHTIRKIN